MSENWYKALEDPYYRLHVPQQHFGEHPLAAQKFPLPDDVSAIHDKKRGRRYMFRPGVIVCRDADRDSGIEDALGDRAERFSEPMPEGDSAAARKDRARVTSAQRAMELSGLISYRLKNPNDRQLKDDVPAIVEELRRWPGKTWDPWPQIVLGIQQDAEYGPALPPSAPVDLEIDAPTDGPGAGLVVAVIDTGVRPEHRLLAGCTRIRDDNDLEVVDAEPDGTRDYVAGHGTFVAGVIRQLAPGAEIVGLGTVRSNGTVTDAEVAGAIDELATEEQVDILNLSLGGYVHGASATGLPCTTDALARLRAKHPRVIVVAAAGNDRKTEPFFPAALGDVIGVGATDLQGNRAWFSNRGPWVDVWTLGVAVSSSYIGPSLTELGGGLTQLGATVKWTGTSFAAPRFAGLLAAALAP